MPKKTLGINYFPFDVDFFSDINIKVLRAKYGNDGVMIYIYLLTVIYREGYFIELTDDLVFIIADELGISSGTVQQVLTFLCKRSLLNSKLLTSDTIITSDGIQRRWQEAVKVRAAKRPIEVGNYWLLSKEETIPHIKCTHFQSNSENIDPNSENIDPNSENIDHKVKKSKVKYISSSTPYNPPQKNEMDNSENIDPNSENIDPNSENKQITLNAIAIRKFFDEFNIIILPNTDMQAFTLENLSILTDKFRRISWLGGEKHDSKWVAERIEQICGGIYDYSIDRDYTVCQELDENGEVKEVVSYKPIEKSKKSIDAKNERRKAQDDMFMRVMERHWTEDETDKGGF